MFIDQVKVKKLDGRHSHRHLFGYLLLCTAWNSAEKYQKIINYCYEQWGATVDVELYSMLWQDSHKRNYEFGFSPKWSYLARYGDLRIYLTKEAATWIQLAEPWNT